MSLHLVDVCSPAAEKGCGGISVESTSYEVIRANVKGSSLEWIGD